MAEPRQDSFKDGVHPCESKGCREYVAFDDEPYCFDHSPDSGSHDPGYSYKAGTKPSFPPQT